MTRQQHVKQILIDLAVEDKLPMDLTTLDESVFDPVFEPIEKKFDDLYSQFMELVNSIDLRFKTNKNAEES